MIIHLQQVIDKPTIDVINEKLAQHTFTDGKLSAGAGAKSVKNNQQLSVDQKAQGLVDFTLQRMLRNPWVEAALRPKTIARSMINRYQNEQSYGVHVDDALMNQARTDISFTLLLSALDEYQGGALTIDEHSGERSWRLDAGDVLIYPSHFLHQVEPVTAGQRTALVGWCQSWVRDAQQRALLFDMQQAVMQEFEAKGRSEQYLLLSKSYQNLLRMWMD